MTPNEDVRAVAEAIEKMRQMLMQAAETEAEHAHCRAAAPTLAQAVLQQPSLLKAVTHCDNCGGTWLDDGLNPIGCPYCKLTPAPVLHPGPWDDETLREAHIIYEASYKDYAEKHVREALPDRHRNSAKAGAAAMRAVLAAAPVPPTQDEPDPDYSACPYCTVDTRLCLKPTIPQWTYWCRFTNS